MPSLRPELHCGAECPIGRYNMPPDNDSHLRIFRESGLAVLSAANLGGMESRDIVLQYLAEACVAKIIRGECPLWGYDPINGRFTSGNNDE